MDIAHLFPGVAVSLGLRAALEKHDISGKIVLLGTPGLRFSVSYSTICSNN